MVEEINILEVKLDSKKKKQKETDKWCLTENPLSLMNKGNANEKRK